MATATAKASDAGKLSFAKVVASPSSKENVPNTAFRSPSNGVKSSRDTPASATTNPSTTTSTTLNSATGAGENASDSKLAGKEDTANKDSKDGSVNQTKSDHDGSVNKVAAELKSTLKTVSKAPDLVVDGTTSSSTERSGQSGNSTGSTQTQTSSDETSQKADSSSELGTKPASIDGKSITSGTTFNALDEKESLRPDDSASVKAAAEDDDAFSVRGSLMVNSRLGSEVAARVHRIQIGDMPLRVVPHIQQEPAAVGVVAPRSSSLEQHPVTEARVQLATNTTPPDALNGQNPDEKLLEAMQTPKDRLFLLRLENDVVNFVQNSKEPFMDLPPSNSFCRMLTHKLADYYHMTHSFEAVAGSVRIYRTPFCRVPPPLASLVAASTPNSGTPPPAIQPKKIMRRGEEGEFTISATPSKPTSEDGSDSKDKSAPAKEKMTREAREEAYNKARERIFGSTVPTEASTPDNDDGTGISRASSVSAKDKALNKKSRTGKQRRDDSESFDSRSQYTAYYNHPQQPTWMPPQFIPVGNSQFNAAQMQMHHQPPLPQQHPQQLPQPHQPHQPHQQHQPPPPPMYPGPIQPQVVYGSTASVYPPMAPPGGLVPQAGSLPPQYPAQPVPARHPPQNAPNVCPYPGSPQQQWQQQQQQQQQQPPPPFATSVYPPAPARSIPPQVPQQAPQQVPQQVPQQIPKIPQIPHIPQASQAPQVSQVPQQAPQPGSQQVGIPYAYGQLPTNVNPNDPKSQHPIPGSYIGNYSRHGFNPKTQSFVPGTGPIPVPGPQAPYGNNGGGPGPFVGHPQNQPQAPGPFPGNGYQQPAMQTPPYGGSPGPVYGMMRQSSTGSGSSYPMPPAQSPIAYQGQLPHAAMVHGPLHGLPHGTGPHGLPVQGGPPIHAPPPPHGLLHHPPRGPSHLKTPSTHNLPHNPKYHGQKPLPHGPKKPSMSSSSNGVTPGFSHLPNYGNPATLPQKPTST